MLLHLLPFGRNLKGEFLRSPILYDSTQSQDAAFLTFFHGNFRPEVDSDVISGDTVEQVCRDVRVTFADCRSNRSRDIRLPHFVTDERRTTPAFDIGGRGPKAKTPFWKFCHKGV